MDYKTITWKDVKLNKGTNDILVKAQDGEEKAQWTVL